MPAQNCITIPAVKMQYRFVVFILSFLSFRAHIRLFYRKDWRNALISHTITFASSKIKNACGNHNRLPQARFFSFIFYNLSAFLWTIDCVKKKKPKNEVKDTSLKRLFITRVRSFIMEPPRLRQKHSVGYCMILYGVCQKSF